MYSPIDTERPVFDWRMYPAVFFSFFILMNWNCASVYHANQCQTLEQVVVRQVVVVELLPLSSLEVSFLMSNRHKMFAG